MSELTRFGISLDSGLLDHFDKLIEKKGYKNRSEAIRDLIRDSLVNYESKESNQESVGTITLIYDHHLRDLSGKLINKQHEHFSQILSTMHLHLDHDNCLEVLALKGKAKEIQDIADKLICTKGVKHGKLVITTTGKDLK